jgi:hypothetical protein
MILEMALFLAALQDAPQEISQAARDELVKLVTIKDDPLEPRITLTTERVAPDPEVGEELQEYYFSMSVDRKTGVGSYFLSAYRFYSDRGIRFYTTLNYIGADGPVSLQIVTADRKVLKCFHPLETCTFRETFTVEIPQRDFLFLANSPAQLEGWLFKYSARSGTESRWFMLPAEAKALISASETLVLKK